MTLSLKFSKEQLTVLQSLNYDQHTDVRRGSFGDYDAAGNFNSFFFWGSEGDWRVCFTRLFNNVFVIITTSGLIALKKNVQIHINSSEADYSGAELISLDEAKRLVDKSRTLNNFK